MRETYLKEFAEASEARRQEIIAIITEMTIDMQSYLLRWHLQAPEAHERLDDQMIRQEVLRNYELLENWGAEKHVETIKHELAAIARSNLHRLSRMTEQGVMHTRWGHDYATGLTASLRKGALLVTTNPPLVNMARKNDPAAWNPVRDRLKREHPAASPECLVSLFTMQVVLANCRELRPIYDATGGAYGYVNFQVNPHHADKADKMAEEIECIHAAMSAELGGTPNVVFKVPGTGAALDTVKRVTSQGIGVTITVSFSVAQHLAFAEAIEQGQAQVSYLVMMNGRLDDPICEELQQQGAPPAIKASRWASTAVVRRSYKLLCEMGIRRSALLVASLRGPWNIDGCLTDGPMPLYITSFPDKTAQYDSQERNLTSHINEPIPEAVLSTLQHSTLFRQAYDRDGLTVEEFETFVPVLRTLTSFCSAYDELVAYMEN